MKKKLISLACFLLTVGMVSACGTKPAPSSSEPTPSSSSEVSSQSEPISGSEESHSSHYSSESSDSGSSEDISSSYVPEPSSESSEVPPTPSSSSELPPAPSSSSVVPPAPSSSSVVPTPSSSSIEPTPSSSSITPTPSSSSIAPAPSSSSITPAPSSSSIAPVHVHEMTKTDAVPATCTKDGVKEYYYCSGCQLYFDDEAGNNEIGGAEALAIWKTTEGQGKIRATGHHFVVTDFALVDNVGKIYEKCDNTGCSETKTTDITECHTVDGLLEELKDLEEGKTTAGYYMCKGGLSDLVLGEDIVNGYLNGDEGKIQIYNLADKTGGTLVNGQDVVTISKIKNYYGKFETVEGAVVSSEEHKASVTLNIDSHSTTDFVPGQYKYLETVSFSVTPEPGYYVDKVTYNGVELTRNGEYKYSFNNAYTGGEVKVTSTTTKPVLPAFSKIANYQPKDGDVIVFSGVNGENEYEMNGINNNLGTAKLIEGELEGSYTFTVVASGSDWKLQHGTGFLGMSADKKVSVADGNKGVWTYTLEKGFTQTYGSTTKKDYSLQFNYNNGNPRFTGYASSMTKVDIWLKNVTCAHPATTFHEGTAATCTTDGIKDYWTCKACDAYLVKDNDDQFVEVSYNDLIIKGGHVVDETKWFCDETQHIHFHKCETCGEVIEESKQACDLKHVDEVPATCTTDGEEAYDYCTVCGYESEHDSIDALGHLNVTPHEAHTPTCVEKGNEAYYTCEREEGVFYKDYDEANDELSNPFDPEIPVNPDAHEFYYTHNGEEAKADSTHNKLCSHQGCDFSQTLPCDFVEDPTRYEEPTPEKEGKIVWVCKDCGAEYEEVLPCVLHSKDEYLGIFEVSDGEGGTKFVHRYVCHGGDSCHFEPSHTGADVEFEEAATGVVASVFTGEDTLGFTSLSAAFEAATTGQTVKLRNNVVLTETLLFDYADKELTLDLNGLCISSDFNDYYMVKVTDGELTIDDSTDTQVGEIRAKVGTNNIPVSAIGNGSVVIKGGNFFGLKASEAVYLHDNGLSASVVIEDGYFAFADPEAVYENPVNINVQNGSNPDHVQVKGGTFTVDPSLGDDYLDSNYVAEGYVLSPDEGEFVVGKFEDLVNNFTTINIATDIEIAAETFINKDLVINLCGNTITSTQASGRLFTVINGATLTINGDAIEGEYDAGIVYGTIRVGAATNNNGSLVINGGEYIAIGNQAAIQNNGTCTDADITINNATVTSASDIAIYVAGGGDVTINNSVVTGDTGIYMKSGHVSVSGGSVIAATGEAQEVTPNGNGANTVGHAIVVESNAGYAGDMNLFIGAGAMITSENGYGILEVVTTADTSKLTKLQLGDGQSFIGVMFDTELENVVLSKEFDDDNFENNSSFLSVYRESEAHKFYYSSLSEALEGALDGEELHIFESIVCEETINIDKDIDIFVDKDIEFDLDEVVKTSYGFVIKSGSSVSFHMEDNSSIVSNASLFYVEPGADLTVGAENDSVESKDRPCLEAYFRVAKVECGAIAFDNIVATTLGNDVTICLFGSTADYSTAILTNSDIICLDANSAITSNGNNPDDLTTALIENCTIVSGVYDKDNDTLEGGDVAIYWPCAGDLEIVNSTVIGKTALYIKGGKTTFGENVTLKGFGEYKGYKYSGGGCNPTGEALVVDVCSYPNSETINLVGLANVTFITECGRDVGTYAHGNNYEHVVVVPGETKEFISTFADKDWSVSEGSDSTWTSDKNGSQKDTKGIQIQTKDSGAGATSDKEYTNITKVIVTYGTSGNIVGEIHVVVGGATYTSPSLVKSLTDAKYEVVLPNAVNGKVKFYATLTGNSVYIKSITVICGGDITYLGARNSMKATVDALDLFEDTYVSDVEVDLPTAPEGFAYGWAINDVPFAGNHVSIPVDHAEDKDYTVKLTVTDPKDALFSYERTFSFTVLKYMKFGTLEDPCTIVEAMDTIDRAGDKLAEQPLFVKGVVKASTYYTSSGGSFTIDITDGVNTLRLFKTKTTGLTNYTAKDSLVGAEIVATGKGTLYGETYELTEGNEVKKFLSLPDATSITIDDGDEIELTTSATYQLSATVLPSTSDQKVTWTSANSSLVSVSESGFVTAVAETGVDGVVITATAKGDDIKDTIKIVVSDEAIPVESVTLNTDTAKLYLDANLQLEATVLPENATDRSVTWTSSDEDVAIVNESGLVTPVAEGTVTITATSNMVETISDSCVVTVTKRPAPVTVECNQFAATSGNIDLNISYAAFKGSGTTDPKAADNILTVYKPSSGASTGGYVTLTANNDADILIVSVTNASGQSTSLKYKVDDGDLSASYSYSKSATVTFGSVDSPLNASKVYIYDTGSQRADFVKISVTYAGGKEEVKYNVSAATGLEHGTVELDNKGLLKEGTEVNVDVKPNSGYVVESIIAGTKTLEEGVTSFVVGEEYADGQNIVVTATFAEAKKYNVSVDGSIEHGSVSISPAAGEMDEGIEVTVTAKPAEGYILDKILVGGVELDGTTFIVGEEYADDKNIVVSASFKQGVQAKTVVYKQSSTSEASISSGEAPASSSCTFKNTYNTKDQLTKDNNMALTLKGYAGHKITGLTLSMKSNSKGGSGNLSVKVGTTEIGKIDTAAFNTQSWYGSWSTSYVDVVIALSNVTYVVKDGEDVVITIAATANSLYCQSFTITYE